MVEKDRTDPRVGCSRVRERGTSGHMPPPTEAREGCSGLVGDACTHQLDGVDDDRLQYITITLLSTISMTPQVCAAQSTRLLP